MKWFEALTQVVQGTPKVIRGNSEVPQGNLKSVRGNSEVPQGNLKVLRTNLKLPRGTFGLPIMLHFSTKITKKISHRGDFSHGDTESTEIF